MISSLSSKAIRVEVIFITQGIRDTYVFAVTDDVYKIKERLLWIRYLTHYSHIILKNYLILKVISRDLSDDLLLPLNFENAAAKNKNVKSVDNFL